MSMLKGYAIPTGIIPKADHTYVKSDNPARSWPCWGRDEGGKEICRGIGDANTADCISQPSSHAGIIYALTGVCHQTSNRILYPAKVIVSDAGGYWVSSLVYGTYGLNEAEWHKRLENCRMAGVKGPSKSIETDTSNVSSEDREKAYLQRVVSIYSEAHRTYEKSSTSLLAKELQLMMEYHLGRSLDSEKTGKALEHQADFLKRKQEMDQDFSSGKLLIEDYVQEANEMVGDLLRQLANALGNDPFKNIFGMAPPEGSYELIDPAIAIKVHSPK